MRVLSHATNLNVPRIFSVLEKFPIMQAASGVTVLK